MGVLNNYAMSTVEPFSSFVTNEANNQDNQEREYLKFLSHSIILTRRSEHGITYELSLFGIMLIIGVLSYHYIGIDRDRFLIFDSNWKTVLFYNDLLLERYNDLIVL